MNRHEITSEKSLTLFDQLDCSAQQASAQMHLSRANPVCGSQWETVWWTKSNFLGKSGKDQLDCDIGNY